MNERQVKRRAQQIRLTAERMVATHEGIEGARKMAEAHWRNAVMEDSTPSTEFWDDVLVTLRRLEAE